MKIRSLYRLFLLICILALSLPYEATCQSKKSKMHREETKWTKDLWYGGGINLNFSSGNFNSIFTLGVSPMAGYKLNSFLSVGPRFSIDWTIAKINDGFNTYNYNSVDFGLGVFARLKFLQNFFAHFEYSQLNETYATIGNNRLDKTREWRDIALIGLGYNSNEIWGYEIYINYNFLEDKSSDRLPIIYRGGITYNF